MHNSSMKKKIDSDKVLRVFFCNELIGDFYWNSIEVSLKFYSKERFHKYILEDILGIKGFFNPMKDSFENTDARGDFNLFIIKACPELFKYAFSYEIIDFKFSSKVAYMFITEFSEGVIVEDLALNCTYNKKDKCVSFWCGERGRMLKVKKILKSAKNRFEFIDSNKYKIIMYPVTIDDYRKYRDSLFINAPTLNTDEGIQGWLINEVNSY